MKNGSFTGYDPALSEYARAQRKNPTQQERKLWYDYLRRYPVKIYRQRVIDRFIADFYCSKAKLVIEIDGAPHFTENGLAYDQARSTILKQYGLAVLRFTDAEIDSNFNSVCSRIHQVIQMRVKALHPGETPPSASQPPREAL